MSTKQGTIVPQSATRATLFVQQFQTGCPPMFHGHMKPGTQSGGANAMYSRTTTTHSNNQRPSSVGWLVGRLVK